MNWIIKSILAVLVLMVTVFGLASKTSAIDLFGSACKQANGSSVCNQAKEQGNKNPIAGPNGLISKAANLLAIVGGVIAVIMVIYSGFLFVAAGGSPIGQRSTDPNQLKKARATLVGALIGAIVIALAWTITRFVTDRIIP